MAPRRVLLPVLGTLLLAAPVLAGGQEATPAPPPPPGQPATGPGGADYAFSHVRATSFVELGVISSTNPRQGIPEQGPTARGRMG